MLQFILNDQDISTDLPGGMTLLDFVRYRQNLKGTKIGCREGDCGACTIMIGELVEDEMRYRTMTSCLMPLANAAGMHIVTIEGINPTDGSLTPVQKAMVDESGTQCGFCTVGFVLSLTNFCIEASRNANPAPQGHSEAEQSVMKRAKESAVSSIDGNICRCTGYKSIERAACRLSEQLPVNSEQFVPEYFSKIVSRLQALRNAATQAETRAVASVPVVSGGTDVYVQRPEELAEIDANHLFYDDELREIRDLGDTIEIGASVTVSDLIESPVMNAVFPDLYKHLKLVSSTPIRNMATLAGNFVNASPIGDMTIWFLALDAEIILRARSGSDRILALKDLYLGYKHLAKQSDEIITAIRFRKPGADSYFNFEKVSKRTYLDIATVNTAISLKLADETESEIRNPNSEIVEAHVSAGGVAPIPLYLKETSAFLSGKQIDAETIAAANEIMQAEISPISDVRGTADYKRLLLRQLFRAHFVELFATEFTDITES